MDRTLTIRKSSSPSYTFTITDIDGSGLNINSPEYGVGITISKEGDAVWTVAPLTVGVGRVPDYFESETPSNIVLFSNTLCRRISTETTTRFIVTLPISITSQFDVSDKYTYEAFLLGIERIDGDRAILYNIPIDSGNVNVLASAIPIDTESTKASAFTVI